MVTWRVLAALFLACSAVWCAEAQTVPADTPGSDRQIATRLRASVPADPDERVAYKRELHRYILELHDGPFYDGGFWLGPRLHLGQIALQDGDYNEALLQLQRAVTLIHSLRANPDGGKRWPETQYLEEAQVMVAECLHELRRHAEASKEVAAVVDRLRQARPPGKPFVLARALHLAAVLATERRDMGQARQHMREASELTLTLPTVASDTVAERLVALIQLAAADRDAPESPELVDQALRSARQSGLATRFPAGQLALTYAALAFRMDGGDLQAARETLQAVWPLSPDIATAAPGLSLALALRRVELAAQLGDEKPFQGEWESLRRQAAALPAAERDLFADLASSMAGASLPLVLAGLGQDPGRAFRAREVTELAASLLVPLLAPEHPRSRLVRLREGVWQLMTFDTPSARASFEQLLQHDAGTSDDAWLRAFATLMLGGAHAVQGHEDAAIALGKDALNAFRSQQSVAPDAACSRACAEIPQLALSGEGLAYRMLTAWLIKAGRLSEAQQVLLILREHELAENLRWGTALAPSEIRATLTGLELERFRSFYRLREQQAALASERLKLQAEQAAGRIDAAGKARLQQLDRLEVEVLKPALSQFLRGLEDAMAAGSDKTVVQNNTSVRAEATQIQRQIDEWARDMPEARAVGIQYLVDRDSLSILVTLPGLSPIARQISIAREDLYGAVYTAQTLMRTPKSASDRLRPALQKLHGLLIAPIEKDLRRMGAHTLLLSLDDRLRQLPFAALMGADGRYLVEDYAIALYNEAVSRATSSAPSRNWRVAAMGTSKPVAGLPALTAVPAELKDVVRATRRGGQTFLDGQFTRTTLDHTLTRQSATPFNVLHMASHFVLQPGDTGASSLFLGDGTSISLAEIARRPLDFRGFELVVYSACETSVAGGRTSNGMEMESLSALTRRQGAASVLGTLWKVSDGSMARAMAMFYDRSAKTSSSLAGTLRLTQLAMLRGESGMSANDRHPFHWAPFVLMGNWR